MYMIFVKLPTKNNKKVPACYTFLRISASSHVGSNKSIIILFAQIIGGKISKTPQTMDVCGESLRMLYSIIIVASAL